MLTHKSLTQTQTLFQILVYLPKVSTDTLYNKCVWARNPSWCPTVNIRYKDLTNGELKTFILVKTCKCHQRKIILNSSNHL